MTILVGYAPSKAADAALDTALDIARSTGEQLEAAVIATDWLTDKGVLG